MKLFPLSFGILTMLFTLSCMGPTAYNPPVKEQQTDLRTETIDAVDALLNNCNGKLRHERPIIVASLVSVDDIHTSSTYGRMAAELIANRITQHGYSVKELKMSQNQIYIKRREGEFILSRDIKDIASKHDVQAVVVGTYAINKQKNRDIFVCLKIVDPVSNIIGCSNCFVSKTHQVNWK